ncbi:BF3164 family lipoprotein [uncultured Proteiniphilum sp.]|uniref:BF3164 family lipoprotein n=1 Tax=uncultured Proteiniphilum sp. TaxID=497637 RepID=UPI002625EB80|nr:BF3164 family lipoprotein [uncultured Proteiniphilum sp.]
MKLNILSIILLILFCFVFSCKDKKETTRHLIQIIDEKETVFSAGELVFKEDLMQFFDMYITDSLVFLTSQRNDSPITALSLKNFERVAELGDRDQGPEGIDFPLFLKNLSRKGDVELLDLNRMSLMHIGYNFEKNRYTMEKEMMPDSLWPSISMNKISDTLYFANGLEHFNKGLYFKWNKQTSIIKEWIPYYPETRKKYDEDVTPLYRNTILANKEKGIVVSALTYFNRIVAFDFNGNILKDIQIGKEAIEPVIEDFELLKFSDGAELFFLNVVGSDNYFYCLWNRSEIGLDKDKRKNSKIFVFDWDLNHVSTIQADQPLVAFDVEPYDRYFLGLFSDDEADTSIYKFAIEL